MSEYHKGIKQSNEKSDQQGLFIQQLTMLDIQGAVKGRFSSFCTAVGIQTLMAMMEQNVAAVAGPKGKHDPDRTRLEVMNFTAGYRAGIMDLMTAMMFNEAELTMARYLGPPKPKAPLAANQ